MRAFPASSTSSHAAALLSQGEACTSSSEYLGSAEHDYGDDEHRKKQQSKVHPAYCASPLGLVLSRGVSLIFHSSAVTSRSVISIPPYPTETPRHYPLEAR